ncbi:MAG TPA: hypothetical protein VGY97_11800, partial [Solirubrobacteraceae bacterium]|nr:hypothetical protein [Solirubrobacteraceae bacterium]
RLLSDEALRRRMGMAGYERFQAEFTSRVWALRTRALYDELLASSRTRQRFRARGRSGSR